MKKQGSVIEFLPQRNAELLAAFKKIVRESSTSSISDMMEEAARTPASRFWVSENRAAEVLAKMFAGDPLDYMLPKRRDMFTALFELAVRYRKMYPKASFYEIACYAVNSPAPEFFLSPASTRVILYNYRKKLKSANAAKLNSIASRFGSKRG